MRTAPITQSKGTDMEGWTCRECGVGVEPDRYLGSVDGEMRREALCFECRFWHEKIAWRGNGDRTDDGRRVLRVGGRHYVVSPDLDGRFSAACSGFGGARFAYRLNGSTESAVSHNMWTQGLIPERFLDRLPDNAAWT